MMKLKSRRLFKSSSNSSSSSAKHGGGGRRGSGVEGGGVGGRGGGGGVGIEWELRPGGMLVQKREGGAGKGEAVINVRVSTASSQCYFISIAATSTFGELKMVLSLVTGLEPWEQRLLFKGKERDDGDHLHMVGVNDSDKVLLLEDPAVKERKLRAAMSEIIRSSPCHTTIKV